MDEGFNALHLHHYDKGDIMFIVVYVYCGVISEVKSFPTMAAAEVYWRENCEDWDPMDDHAGIYDENGVVYKELEEDPEYCYMEGEDE